MIATASAWWATRSVARNVADDGDVLTVGAVPVVLSVVVDLVAWASLALVFSGWSP